MLLANLSKLNFTPLSVKNDPKVSSLFFSLSQRVMDCCVFHGEHCHTTELAVACTLNGSPSPARTGFNCGRKELIKISEQLRSLFFFYHCTKGTSFFIIILFSLPSFLI